MSTFFCIPRNEFTNAREGVLQYESCNVALLLILCNEVDTDRSAQRLSVDNDPPAFQLIIASQKVERRLSINLQPLFIRIACRSTVTTILQHEDVATNLIGQDLCYGYAITDVACVTVKHEDSNVTRILYVCWSNVEGVEFLPVGSGYHEIFEVLDSELRGGGYVGSGIRRDISRVYDLAVYVHQFAV